ncbi:MAG TPA: outer membrane protein assembly factor BamE [Xylella sp.]
MRNLLLTAILPLLFTTGCNIIYKQPIYQGNLIQKEAVNQLKVGMNKQQVAMLLGTPSISDVFHADRWDYTSAQRTPHPLHTEVKNFTIYFQNDLVTRWEGNYFPNQDEKLAESARKQFGPNLSRKERGSH